jgi:hypothetical protein
VCRRCGGSLRPGVAHRSMRVANELTPFLYHLPPVVGIRVHFIDVTSGPRVLPFSVACCWCLLPTSSIARMHISKSWINGVREFQTTLFCNDNSYVSTQGNTMVTPFVCSACRVEITDHVHRAPLFFVHDDSVIVDQLNHPYLPKNLAHLVLSYYRSPPSTDSDRE